MLNDLLLKRWLAATIEYNQPNQITESPAMHRPNFCVECGQRLALRGWRARLKVRFCDACALRLGNSGLARSLAMIAVIALSAFALGRWLRPAPPPLIIQRAINSPLSDLPVNLNAAPGLSRDGKERTGLKEGADSAAVDDVVYLCGARTQKGTPCRRRVHFAGERCYQHKGMPAIVPLEKLTVKNK